jgi:hypothetical protein
MRRNSRRSKRPMMCYAMRRSVASMITRAIFLGKEAFRVKICLRILSQEVGAFPLIWEASLECSIAEEGDLANAKARRLHEFRNFPSVCETFITAVRSRFSWSVSDSVRIARGKVP